MEGESLMRHLLWVVKRKAHWPWYTVARYLQADYELLVVLSSGEQLAALLPTFQWRRILPGAGWVCALAAMRT